MKQFVGFFVKQKFIISLIMINALILLMPIIGQAMEFTPVVPSPSLPSFLSPAGIAIDKNDNVYVVDTLNFRIIKFDRDGNIITEWGKQGSGEGEFSSPKAITLDRDGDVYITDIKNNCIQKFDSMGNFVAKFGGKDQFNSPCGIGVDRNKNIYVSDSGNRRIQILKSDGSSGIWSVGGEPAGISISSTVDGNDIIWVVNSFNHQVQKYDINGTLQKEWGSFGSNSGQFQFPYGICVDQDGNIYVADTSNNRIQKFNADGTFLFAWQAPESIGGLGNPFGVAVNSHGEIFISDQDHNRVIKLNNEGNLMAVWESKGITEGRLNEPWAVMVDQDGNIYVVDRRNSRIQKYDATGSLISSWGEKGSGDGQFRFDTTPLGIALDGSGNVYVSDTFNKRVQKFNKDGVFQTKWSIPGAPRGIAVDNMGCIYVADSGNRIQKFDSNGMVITTWTGPGDAQFNNVNAVAVDGSNYVYVTDTKGIHKFDTQGNFLNSWSFTSLSGIAVDQAGFIYVTEDGYRQRVQKLSPEGVVLATWGEFESGREGGFNEPKGIGVDKKGNVFVADTMNHRIQFLITNPMDGGGLNSEASNSCITPQMIEFKKELYTAWVESRNGCREIRVQKYDGVKWQDTQEVPINIDEHKNAYNPVLSEFKGELYLAWYEETGEDKIFQVYVRKYNPSENNWSEAENLSFSGNKAFNIKLAANDEKLFALWIERNGVVNQVRAKVFDGQHWLPLEKEGQVSGMLNENPNHNATLPYLASYHGNIYAAWSEKGKIKVKRFNVTEGNEWEWKQIDGGGLNYDAAKIADMPVLVPGTNYLYLIWAERDEAKRFQVRVKKYYDSIWEESDQGSLNFDANQSVYMLTGKEYNGVLYAAWTENGIVRMKFLDTESNNWVPVKDEVINYSTPETSSGITFQEYYGKLYISWQENNGRGEQIRVKLMEE
jgi:DNA-binding beta-propeller fold protein YncE